MQAIQNIQSRHVRGLCATRRRRLGIGLLALALIATCAATASAGNKFQGNKFQGASLQGNKFQGNKFQGASLQGNKFQGNKFQGASLQGNKFQGNKFQGASLQGNKFQGNKFQGPSLQHTQPAPGAKKPIEDSPAPVRPIPPVDCDLIGLSLTWTPSGMRCPARPLRRPAGLQRYHCCW